MDGSLKKVVYTINTYNACIVPHGTICLYHTQHHEDNISHALHMLNFLIFLLGFLRPENHQINVPKPRKRFLLRRDVVVYTHDPCLQSLSMCQSFGSVTFNQRYGMGLIECISKTTWISFISYVCLFIATVD